MKRAFGNVISFGKPLLRIAENVVIIFLEVVRLVVVDEVGLRLHRLFGIEVGGQDFVLDVDQFQRLIRSILVNGSDAGHVIADVADLVEGQRVSSWPTGRIP